MWNLKKRKPSDPSLNRIFETLLTPSTSKRVKSPQADAAMEAFLEAQSLRNAQERSALDMASGFETTLSSSDRQTSADTAQRIAEAFLQASELAYAEIDLKVAELNISIPNQAQRARDIQQVLDGYAIFGIPRKYLASAQKWQERAESLRKP